MQRVTVLCAIVATTLLGGFYAADIGAQRQLRAYVEYCESGQPNTQYITCDNRRLAEARRLLRGDD